MKIFLTESQGYSQDDIYAKSWDEAEEVLKYCKQIFDFPPDTEIVGELQALHTVITKNKRFGL